MEEIVDQELGSDSDRLVETVSSYVQVWSVLKKM
jgi:hypothetical protein